MTYYIFTISDIVDLDCTLPSVFNALFAWYECTVQKRFDNLFSFSGLTWFKIPVLQLIELPPWRNKEFIKINPLHFKSHP